MSDEEWLRLPDEGERCAVSGLSRTSLAELLEETDSTTGEKCVASFTKKKPGATRGIRLINKKSLLQYLQKIAASQVGLQWADHITNPHGYSLEEVLKDRELFLMFIGDDNKIPDEAWEAGSLSSRQTRLAALVATGTLIPTR